MQFCLGELSGLKTLDPWELLGALHAGESVSSHLYFLFFSFSDKRCILWDLRSALDTMETSWRPFGVPWEPLRTRVIPWQPLESPDTHTF